MSDLRLYCPTGCGSSSFRVRRSGSVTESITYVDGKLVRVSVAAEGTGHAWVICGCGHQWRSEARAVDTIAAGTHPGRPS